jgi:hypothetical protein
MSMLSALATLTMSYCVFDIKYLDELESTFNFLDVHVGGMDQKSKIHPAVQRYTKFAACRLLMLTS